VNHPALRAVPLRAGMLSKPPRSLTIEEMDEAIACAIIEK
jgi:hypothetical protein